MFPVRYLVLVVAMLCPGALFSQGCDETIRERGKALGNLGYQPRPQNRCEGLYYDNVNGVTIDLVSLTQGRVRYRLSEDEIISIHKLPSTTSDALLIRGTSFKSSPKYRLDMSWDKKKQSIQLPLKDVLNASQISSTDVGFYGYVETSGEPLYFPVITTTKFYKSPESENIYLTVLSNIETSQMVYKIADHTNGTCGVFSPEYKLDAIYEKMEPVEIKIPQSKSAKQLCIKVSVLPAGTNQSWIPKEFVLFVPASGSK